MAVAGTFISQIEKIIQIKSTLTTPPPAIPLENEIDSSSSDDSRPVAYDINDYTESNYAAVFDTDLTSLTIAQRNIFLVTLTVLFLLSLCGNICTLFVNFRRKLRPLFRTCLISLALSDLMNTLFLATSYFSQFTADFVQIWNLGGVLCSLVPFGTTCAILASSMTLVGIALDRYFAVMKAVIGFWNPSLISCIACMLCIWLASISIACPVYTFYHLIPVYILTEANETVSASIWPTKIPTTSTISMLTTKNGFVIMTPKQQTNITMQANLTIMKSSLAAGAAEAAKATGNKMSWKVEKETALEDLSPTVLYKQKLVNMCASDQKNASVYYAFVFAIVFVPCIVAFFCFNSVIARKLWRRRCITAIQKQQKCLQPKSNCKSTVDTIETEQPKCVIFETVTDSGKSIPTCSATVPISAANTLCRQVNTPAVKSETTSVNFNVTINKTREARHLRMFNIILLMMTVFVFLRLPAWIFLLMRLYGHYSQPSCWILYFIFGLMNLCSSVFNPLFYTFLTETIHYALKFKARVSCVACGCYRSKYGTSNDSATSLEAAQNNGECNSVVNEMHETSCFKATTFNKIFSVCRAISCCHRATEIKTDHAYNNQTHSLPYEVKSCSNDSLAAANNDKDEGVDCNDEMNEENIDSFDDYNQRIHTIFPASLVSSSINSETFYRLSVCQNCEKVRKEIPKQKYQKKNVPNEKKYQHFCHFTPSKKETIEKYSKKVPKEKCPK